MRDTLTHLSRALPKEDLSFINFRAVRGSPDVDIDRFTALAKRIYADSANADARPAYYGGQSAPNTPPQAGATNPAAELKYLSRNAEAIIEEMRGTLLTSTQVPSQQMTALLEEAKLVLVQRRVDGEAQVAEAMGVIDAVLRNIRSFEKAGTSAQSHKFNDVYSLDIKKDCELAVGRGRDPYPLIKQLEHREETDEAFDKRFQQAMESVQPQARFMAEELKNILRPYAQISPPPSENLLDEAAPADPTPGKPAGAWQRA